MPATKRPPASTEAVATPNAPGPPATPKICSFPRRVAGNSKDLFLPACHKSDSHAANDLFPLERPSHEIPARRRRTPARPSHEIPARRQRGADEAIPRDAREKATRNTLKPQSQKAVGKHQGQKARRHQENTKATKPEGHRKTTRSWSQKAARKYQETRRPQSQKATKSEGQKVRALDNRTSRWPSNIKVRALVHRTSRRELWSIGHHTRYRRDTGNPGETITRDTGETPANPGETITRDTGETPAGRRRGHPTRCPREGHKEHTKATKPEGHRKTPRPKSQKASGKHQGHKARKP